MTGLCQNEGIVPYYDDWGTTNQWFDVTLLILLRRTWDDEIQMTLH